MMTDKEVQEYIKNKLKSSKKHSFTRYSMLSRKKKASNPEEPLKQFLKAYREDLKKKRDEILAERKKKG